MNLYLKRLTTTGMHRVRDWGLAPSALCFSLVLCVGMANAVTCRNNLQPSNPDAVYTIGTNGTVTDVRTGLMWKVCSEGQTWSPDACAGAASTFTWPQAIAQAEAGIFAGYSDWRLPNIKELQTLVEECRVNPSINENAFPSTVSLGFWSGSPVGGVSSQFAWSVSFNSGISTDGLVRAGSNYVRLVRAGQ